MFTCDTQLALYFILGTKRKITKLGKCDYLWTNSMRLIGITIDELNTNLLDDCGLYITNYNMDGITLLPNGQHRQENKVLKETSIDILVKAVPFMRPSLYWHVLNEIKR